MRSGPPPAPAAPSPSAAVSEGCRPASAEYTSLTLPALAERAYPEMRSCLKTAKLFDRRIPFRCTASKLLKSAGVPTRLCPAHLKIRCVIPAYYHRLTRGNTPAGVYFSPEKPYFSLSIDGILQIRFPTVRPISAVDTVLTRGDTPLCSGASISPAISGPAAPAGCGLCQLLSDAVIFGHKCGKEGNFVIFCTHPKK